jgi:hypothetical protein
LLSMVIILGLIVSGIAYNQHLSQKMGLPETNQQQGHISNPTTIPTKTTTTQTTPTLTPTVNAAAGEVCAARTIPHETVTEYVSWLTVGQQSTISGYDGNQVYCTNSSGVERILSTYPATKETISIGTRERITATTPTPTPIDTRIPYQQAYSNALRECSRYSDSSAYQPCISAVLQTYGY